MNASLRHMALLFVVALIARLSFFAVIAMSDVQHDLLTGDGATFLTIAQNLQMTGIYSALNTPSPTPTANYVPLYPLFLIATGGIQHPLMTLIIQCIIGSASTILIYAIGRRAGLQPLFALAGGMFYALEPGIIFYTNQLYTETLFGFFLLLSLFFLLRQKSYDILLSGACLGISTLVRPIGLYIMPLYILFIAAQEYKKGTLALRFIKILAIFSGVFVAILAPWIARNFFIFGSPMLSTQSSYLIAANTLPAYVAWKEQRPFVEAQRFVQITLEPQGYNETFILQGDAATRQAILSMLRRILAQDPAGLLWSQLRSAPHFLISSGWQTAYETITTTKTEAVQYGEYAALTVPRLLGSGFWLVMSIGAAFALIITLITRTKEVSIYLLFGAIVGIFFVLTGALSHARYRMPVTGLIMILAVKGVEEAFQCLPRAHLREKLVNIRK